MQQRRASVRGCAENCAAAFGPFGLNAAAQLFDRIFSLLKS
jgi:hypothetical protein